MGTPGNLKFQALFNINQITVLGTVNEELKEKLRPLGTNVRGYTGGGYKPLIYYFNFNTQTGLK